MATAPERESQKTLGETENCSTRLLAGGRGAVDKSNDKYNFRGHKSSDRKTGLGQAEDHYSWKQVYYACEVNSDPHGGDGE